MSLCMACIPERLMMARVRYSFYEVKNCHNVENVDTSKKRIVSAKTIRRNMVGFACMWQKIFETIFIHERFPNSHFNVIWMVAFYVLQYNPLLAASLLQYKIVQTGKNLMNKIYMKPWSQKELFSSQFFICVPLYTLPPLIWKNVFPIPIQT